MDFAHQSGLSLMLANLNNSYKQSIDTFYGHRLNAVLKEEAGVEEEDDDDDEEGEQ